LKQISKQCPGCTIHKEKNECEHMTCKHCEHEFCCMCRAPYHGARGVMTAGNQMDLEGCPCLPREI
ncbi:hypothetical protein DOTSEDRAFT_115537, partial [Dothistroma septosporum NZE10]